MKLPLFLILFPVALILANKILDATAEMIAEFLTGGS